MIRCDDAAIHLVYHEFFINVLVEKAQAAKLEGDRLLFGFPVVDGAVCIFLVQCQRQNIVIADDELFDTLLLEVGIDLKGGKLFLLKRTAYIDDDQDDRADQKQVEQ